MSACEKCWTDAVREYATRPEAWESHVEVFEHLINERGGHRCTPEQQRGEQRKGGDDSGD